MQAFAKRHWIALALAIAIGFLSGLPQILAINALGPEYAGLNYLYQDSEDVYQTRIREIFEGHTASSPFFFEYKNKPNLQLSTGEYFYYLLAIATNSSLSGVVFASKFVFPAILFLLVYIFCLLTFEGKSGQLGALAAAALVSTSATDIVISAVPSLWTRLVNPITGGLLLFGFLILIRLLIDRPNALLALIIGGVLTLMNGYIFSYGIAFAILVILTIKSLFNKDKKLFWYLITALVFSLALIFVYLLLIWGAYNSTNSSALVKNGLFFTHLPLNNKFFLVALVVFVFCWWQRKNSEKLNFLFITVLGAFAALNQHVLTGMTVWPFHFQQYIRPLVVIFIIAAIITFLKNKRLGQVLMIVLIIISLGYGILVAKKYGSNLENFRDLQRFAPTLTWLTNNNNDGCVVLVPEWSERLDRTIPAYTPCDVYTSHYTFFNIPVERLHHNYNILLALNNVPPQEAETFIRDHEETLRFWIFRDWRDLFFHQLNDWLKKISDEQEIARWLEWEIKTAAQRYQVFSKLDLLSELKRYRIDYVAIDGAKMPNFDAKLFPFLEKVFEKKDVTLYKIND